MTTPSATVRIRRGNGKKNGEANKVVTIPADWKDWDIGQDVVLFDLGDIIQIERVDNRRR